MLDTATKAQVWSLKSYWLSYQLAILDALVKDMGTTFADSTLPPEIASMLDQLQPIVNNCNKDAKQLCDSTSKAVDHGNQS